MKDFKFLWGASTSAYQVEGGYDEDGKGLSVQDIKILRKGYADFKIASDHYHRYKEDIKLFSELGLRAYRFSISWSRIFPKDNITINEKGIEFYSNLINELLKYNIEPVITMYHFDLPQWLEAEGGWKNRKTISSFEKYANILFERFSDKVKYFITINEQNMMILHSESIDGSKEDKYKYQKNHNIFVAHAKVVKLAHEKYKNIKITAAPNIAVVYPNSSKPEDNKAAQVANAIRNWLYLDMYVYGRYNVLALEYIQNKGYVLEIEKEDMEIIASAKVDYIAINYYYTSTVESYKNEEYDLHNIDNPFIEKGYFKAVINKNLKFTDFKWQIDDEGFSTTLNEVYQRYYLPILVTENGLGARDILEKDGSIHDTYRIEYLKNHINKLNESRGKGVKIIGYMPWSAIDLISTHQGFEKRYGFIYVNREDNSISDLNRYKKDSFYWYKKFIEKN